MNDIKKRQDFQDDQDFNLQFQKNDNCKNPVNPANPV